MMTNRFACALRALLAALVAGVLAVPACAESVYKFSAVPQFAGRQMLAIWQPIMTELQARTGARFEFVTAASVNDYEQGVRQGRYDFIYLNPYRMPEVAGKPGYVPLVRDSQPVRGILVVRRDSPFQRVEDLQGKTLAVPSLGAIGASLLLRAELDRKFGVRLRPVVAQTHSSVFLHVINGFTDAGGSVQKALAEQEPRVRDALRVLYETGAIPAHPVAALKRVPADVRERVRQAFIDMSADPAGRRLLAAIPMRGAVPAHIEEYQALSALHLEQYADE